MEVNIHIPHPLLKEYVLNISTVKAVLPGGMKSVITPYPPTPFQSLMFYCNHPVSMNRVDDESFVEQPTTVVIGPQFSRVNIQVHNQLSAIRVDFLPGGLFRMLGIPMHELFDAGFNSLDLFGAEMKSIDEQIRNIESLEEGKNIVQEFLVKQTSGLR